MNNSKTLTTKGVGKTTRNDCGSKNTVERIECRLFSKTCANGKSLAQREKRLFRVPDRLPVQNMEHLPASFA
jgi:hypothetical protein